MVNISFALFPSMSNEYPIGQFIHFFKTKGNPFYKLILKTFRDNRYLQEIQIAAVQHSHRINFQLQKRVEVKLCHFHEISMTRQLIF